jgi:hypothetical protein
MMWRKLIVSLLALFIDRVAPEGITYAQIQPRQAGAMPQVVHQAAVQAARSSQNAATSDPLSSIAASEGKANAAVAAAEAAVKQVAQISKDNLAYLPQVRGAESDAKTALQTAKDAAAEAHRIAKETKIAADAAAMQSAKDYMQEVKVAAHNARKSIAAARAKAESDAEVKAAMAAAKAVEPYHTALMRGQKVMQSYQTRAQELAIASNNLKAQAHQLAGSANGYQWMGYPIQAQQIMMQAHAMFQYADMMKAEANRLHGIAIGVMNAGPAIQEATMAAADHAQENAMGGLPDIPSPYFLQRSSSRKHSELQV